jgi:uncharacterized protein with HEPN domain
VKSDLPYLAHIADSILAIQSYVADGREDFMRQRLIQDAVIRNFEIIGEAAGKISNSTRDRSGAPWKNVVAFRNRLIHGYWSVDLMLVWNVIENDLPRLKVQVDHVIAELRDSTDQ